MVTNSIAGHDGRSSLSQSESWRFRLVTPMLNGQFDLLQMVLVEDVILDDILGSVLEAANDALLWWRGLFWLMSKRLLELKLGTFLLGSCVLEPNLDDPLLETNVPAEIGTLCHGGCLVILKNRFHHLDLKTRHLGAKTLVARASHASEA